MILDGAKTIHPSLRKGRYTQELTAIKPFNVLCCYLPALDNVLIVIVQSLADFSKPAGFRAL